MIQVFLLKIILIQQEQYHDHTFNYQYLYILWLMVKLNVIVGVAWDVLFHEMVVPKGCITLSKSDLV